MGSSSNGADDPAVSKKRRPTPRNALPCTSENIAHVELFRPKTIIANTTNTSNGKPTIQKKKRRVPLKRYHLLFALLYLHQAYWIYSTIGVPYKEFLDKAEREGFEGKKEVVSFII